ncbi:LUD domain-containing protein [bacterium]|nr:LUD domain-containing protein [bacterium]
MSKTTKEQINLSRIETVTNALQTLDVEVIRTTDSGLGVLLIDFLVQAEATGVALSSDQVISDLKLPAMLKAAGFEVIPSLNQSAGPIEAGRWKTALAKVDVGITSTPVMAAETGSALMLAKYPDDRAVSLLPPWHILLVAEENLVDDIASLMKKWGESSDRRENAVLVTGPSRTADIEKELVLGVHGPGKMTVMIYRSNP